jgi:hypothetical protein
VKIDVGVLKSYVLLKGVSKTLTIFSVFLRLGTNSVQKMPVRIHQVTLSFRENRYFFVGTNIITLTFVP